MKTAVCLILGCYLAVAAIYDLKTKSISRQLELLGLVPVAAALIMSAVSGADLWEGIRMMLLGLIPGVITAIIAYVTKGGIGLGDAAVILVIGCSVGLMPAVEILGTAFLMVCLFSVVLLIAGRMTRKSRLPFIPFLTAAYMAGFAARIM